MKKLKLCPLCGSIAILMKCRGGFWIACNSKECIILPADDTAFFISAKKATDAWNKREKP